jgi:uncharacterized membrane protein YgdD (TMEM256/DUF423 family)
MTRASARPVSRGLAARGDESPALAYEDWSDRMMWSVIGSVLLALAVLIGAFGAHALRARLDAYATGIYERAVFYHFVHALGLVILGVAVRTNAASQPAAAVAGWLLVVGIVIFCGSLYALALSGIRALGAITPIGGLAFVVGWAALAVSFAR